MNKETVTVSKEDAKGLSAIVDDWLDYVTGRSDLELEKFLELHNRLRKAIKEAE